MIFLTIVSTFLRRYALWKAQKGAYVAKLEQLNASTSLPSALKTAFTLKEFGLTTLWLIVLWSFSYLGSQAVKLEYALQQSQPYEDFNVVLQGKSGYSALENTNITDAEKLYIWQNAWAARVSKTEKGYDMSGGALIPILPGDSNDGKWQHAAAKDPYWSSNMGLDIWLTGTDAADDDVVGSFTTNSTYIQASCSGATYMDQSTPGIPAANFSFSSIDLVIPDEFVTKSSLDSAPLVILSLWVETPKGTALATCNLTRIYVEISATCEASGCITEQWRFTPGTQPLNTPTLLTTRGTLQNLIDGLQIPGGSYAGLSTENTILDSYTVYNAYSNGLSDFDTMQNEANVVSASLTNSINTYVDASTTTLNQYNMGDSISVYNRIYNGTITDPLFDIVNFNGALYAPQYVLSIPWLVLDAISTVILLVGAIFSFVLRKKTYAPDIFGFVSTVTRDNPHLASSMPGLQGSTLSGIERAKRMKKVKIQFAGVHHPHSSGTGHKKVGVIKADIPGYEVTGTKLSREDMYV
jgi:hypothetical protein